MEPANNPYRSRSGRARALAICQAIVAHRREMKPFRDGYSELRAGSYTILYAPPETHPNGPCHNVNVWRSNANRKLANIEFDGSDRVHLLSFRTNDPWDQELLQLLATGPHAA